MIESYDFGQITIKGRRYSQDVIVLPDNVVKDNWWRKEGHRLSLEDLKEVFEAKPEVLVVGTGYNGFMRVSQEVKDFAKSKNIELVVENTRRAWQTYNRLCSSSKRVAAAFHLTC